MTHIRETLELSKSVKDIPAHIFFIVHIKRNETQVFHKSVNIQLGPSNSFSGLFFFNEESAFLPKYVFYIRFYV